MNSYRTIQADGQAEIEVKKSRFICSMKRIETEAEAKAFIQATKKEHWKANHNCSAFVLGEKNEIQRSSDDGEPSGTAGVPMLEVLKKNELINVVAVVTRYFGGTKLGTGGLIRAYTQAVSHALIEIGIVEGTQQQEIAVHITYPQLGKLENMLELKHIPIKETIYTDKVTVHCLIVETEVTAFKTAVVELLNGQVEFTDGPISYHEQLVEADQ
ncbi:YigZ family protein [Enterococcus hirae]